jgi:predicted NBD/HSP70 family sugar kinase/predicted transcriptional regulator
MSKKKPMVLKNVNRFSILNYIRRNRFTTKAAIAAESGLSFMAVQNIIGELESAGLVRQASLEGGRLGRKSATYIINEKYAYTLGLHINMFETKAALLNLKGDILGIKSLPMEGIGDDAAQFIELTSDMIHSLINENDLNGGKILGLGIGTPGPVNIEDDRILSPPNMKMLRYLPFRRMMEDRIGIPVILHRDANAIAMGEYWCGAGFGYNNMVYIDADMGIGCGLVFDSELLVGKNYVAGEFGHITIAPMGPICNCGKQGCLEAVGSGISILRDFTERIRKSPEHPLYAEIGKINIQQILKLGNEHDLPAISVLNEAAHNMGIAIVNLINILDPDIIIMGGILTTGYDEYLEIIKEVVISNRLNRSSENLIVKTANGDKAGIIGAGEIVVDNFFKSLVGQELY